MQAHPKHGQRNLTDAADRSGREPVRERPGAGDRTFLGKICGSRETGLGVGQAAVM